MIKNYIIVAFRNFLRFRTFSVINLLGLAVGVTCFITLTLFIISELTYDSSYKNADNIYRIYVHQNINNAESSNSKTPAPLGPALLAGFPEVKSFTRIGYFGQYTFRYRDNVFNEGNIYGVDSTFFDFFTVPFIKGNPGTALTRPNTIVLTETAAARYFGTENPLGKTLIVKNSFKADYLNRSGFGSSSEDFIVTGVIEDFPVNSHFSCDFLTSIHTYKLNDYWLDLWYSTYIMLDGKTDPAHFESKLKNVLDKYVGPLAEQVLGISLAEFKAAGNTYDYNIQPMKSIYLYSKSRYGVDLNTEWGSIKSSDPVYIYIFGAVAVFILILAVINFMNLSTARSERRAKEVGIRKALGSGKMMLIGQFISEAILMSLFAVLLSLALVELVLPFFNNVADRELSLAIFSNFYTIPLLVLFVVFVGILAGSYPAFYLSSFEPVQVIKGTDKGRRKSTIRSVLVTLQFTISIMILIGTLVVREQLNYIQQKNLGFNKSYLYSILNANLLGSKIEAFRNELLRNSNISDASGSSQMFRSGVPGSGYLYNKNTGTDPVSFQYVETDYDFLKTYQVKLSQGRFFSREFSADSDAVVINETALKACGDKFPLGKELNRIGSRPKNYTIIGVIKDFNYESLHHQVRPLALHLVNDPEAVNTISIRIASADMNNTIEYIRETYKKFSNGEDMFGRFADENIARLYRTEEKIGVIAAVFSTIAIFIACLGLFGLSAFVTEQRTKEIGVRKALGASKTDIVLILSKHFALCVLVANIIAWPVAWFVMRSWLENFAFRITPGLFTFILSGLTALVIALGTMSVHAVKAASANPIKSLRYE